eukprot:gnl/MRDRNA2_/MRDRNA2_60538_c0_seq1.p1 gnl/MRDRNA2_/MRDRNA2_60538_c0~~gnl/MRDRNA2_/MRDRNA2_60538_c0_seq1.p1  ORF type:complete len:506 (+),score=128.52 gnl/MRDRNA2_/MRDRNA2_60538_c0_seq1:96-1613(+)
MCSTTQAGMDFVQCLMRDMQSLKDQVGQLQSQLSQEQKSVQDAMLVLEGQISTRVAREEHQGLVERLTGLDAEVKQSFADVASERDSMKIQFTNINEILGVVREEHLATNARVAHLERDRDEKTTHIDQIAARVAHIESDIATKAGAHDLRAAMGRLQELECGMGERAMRNDLFQLTATVQALEAELMQRSPITDVRALELKMRSCEASLESVQADVSRKAVKVDLDSRIEAVEEMLEKVKSSLKEQVGQLDKEINETRKAGNAAHEVLGRDLQHLQHAVGSDGEHMSARFAAVDKELSTRAFSADVADVANRVGALEHSFPPLERTVGAIERTLSTKADSSEARTSIEALENAVATKANHSDLLRACLGLEDQVTKMESVSSRVETCERSLDTKVAAVDHASLLRKHDAVESQVGTFQKAATDVETLQVILFGSSKQPERSADYAAGCLTKRLNVAELRIEDLSRLTERKADIEEMRQRLAGKADQEHFHDRIVSIDGKTTFAI